MNSSKNKCRPQKFCQVCGDRAVARNFDAVTCESCKAFFRRNAFNGRLKCSFEDHCSIDKVTRKFCSRCRLKKCLAVGMKCERILNEDEKERKRLIIMENRLKRAKTFNIAGTMASISGSDDNGIDLNNENDDSNNSNTEEKHYIELAPFRLEKFSKRVETRDVGTSCPDESELFNVTGPAFRCPYSCSYCMHHYNSQNNIDIAIRSNSRKSNSAQDVSNVSVFSKNINTTADTITTLPILNANHSTDTHNSTVPVITHAYRRNLSNQVDYHNGNLPVPKLQQGQFSFSLLHSTASSLSQEPTISIPDVYRIAELSMRMPQIDLHQISFPENLPSDTENHVHQSTHNLVTANTKSASHVSTSITFSTNLHSSSSSKFPPAHLHSPSIISVVGNINNDSTLLKSSNPVISKIIDNIHGDGMVTDNYNGILGGNNLATAHDYNRIGSSPLETDFHETTSRNANISTTHYDSAKKIPNPSNTVTNFICTSESINDSERKITKHTKTVNGVIEYIEDENTHTKYAKPCRDYDEVIDRLSVINFHPSEMARMEEILNVWRKILSKEHSQRVKVIEGERCTRTFICFFEFTLELIINSVKMISSFRELTIDDQIILLKTHCIKLLIIRAAFKYCDEINGWLDSRTGKEFNLYKFPEFQKSRACEQHFKFVSQFDRYLRQDKIVIILLMSVVIFDTSNLAANFNDRYSIHLEHVTYLGLLKKYITRTQPDPLTKYENLMNVLTILNLANDEYKKFFAENPQSDVGLLLNELFDIG